MDHYGLVANNYLMYVVTTHNIVVAVTTPRCRSGGSAQRGIEWSINNNWRCKSFSVEIKLSERNSSLLHLGVEVAYQGLARCVLRAGWQWVSTRTKLPLHIVESANLLGKCSLKGAHIFVELGTADEVSQKMLERVRMGMGMGRLCSRLETGRGPAHQAR